MHALNAPELQQLDARAERVINAVQVLVSPLDHARRQRNPAPGAWSVDQILEHLCLLNGTYLTVIRSLLDSATVAPRQRTRNWKPTLAGGMLARLLEPTSTWKLPAPGQAKPGPVPRADVLAHFTGSMRELQQLMRRADDLDLGAYTFRSPFAAIMKLNLGDAFAVTVVHADRHSGQIERAINATA